jgi:hypothetical protein
LLNWIEQSLVQRIVEGQIQIRDFAHLVGGECLGDAINDMSDLVVLKKGVIVCMLEICDHHVLVNDQRSFFSIFALISNRGMTTFIVSRLGFIDTSNLEL